MSGKLPVSCCQHTSIQASPGLKWWVSQQGGTGEEVMKLCKFSMNTSRKGWSEGHAPPVAPQHAPHWKHWHYWKTGRSRTMRVQWPAATIDYIETVILTTEGKTVMFSSAFSSILLVIFIPCEAYCSSRDTYGVQLNIINGIFISLSCCTHENTEEKHSNKQSEWCFASAQAWFLRGGAERVAEAREKVRMDILI